MLPSLFQPIPPLTQLDAPVKDIMGFDKVNLPKKYVGELPPSEFDPVEEHKIIDTGLGVTCSDCMVATLSDPDVKLAGFKNLEEEHSFLIMLAKKNGWGHRVNNGAASFQCPACIKKKETAVDTVLPKFDIKSKCGKCGSGNAKTIFCDGISNCSHNVPRHHLHRTCPQCGFEWLEGCLDDKKVKSKGKKVK